MVYSVVNRTREEFFDLLEEQEDCDIIFVLKDQVVIGGHSQILSAFSNKFNCKNCDSQLVFYMDPRIEQSDMWVIMKYLYIKENYVIDLENMDSYILLAYFFHDPILMLNADIFLWSTVSEKSAFNIFHYAIDMNMSYSCKERIYEYINENVFKWPTSYTLDMVLMNPDVLSIAQIENTINMDEISTCVHDSTPIIANNKINSRSVGDLSSKEDALLQQIKKLVDSVEQFNMLFSDCMLSHSILNNKEI